ncbi:unnamed protein product [Penicillium pancosmium]
MLFLGLLLALSQIPCCWAIDSRTLEVDLILPRNDTYPPSPIFPIIFAVQNPSLAEKFQPMISLQVHQVGGNLSISETYKLWEGSNDTSNIRFLTWGNSKFDFEGEFKLTWDLSVDRCHMDNKTHEVNFGRFDELESLFFTTKNGTSPPDFVAATDDDTCDKALAQVINYADLSKVPASESTYGPSCLAAPTTLPKTTSPCNVKINSSAAASGAWILATVSWLAYCLA